MTHRLFVAIRPPPPIRDALIDRMEGIEGARWQSDDQLHLTLRYIGEVDGPQAEDIAGELEKISLAPFRLKIVGVGHFERKGVPKSVWVAVEPSSRLHILQRRVERACRRAGREPETRKFIPHITLARLNASTGSIGGFLRENASFSLPEWEIDAFLLFESRLSRFGSDYNAIARYPLR